MALSVDIWILKERVLADLTSAHDYYIDTKVAWRVVLAAAKENPKLLHRNKTTGTITTRVELAAKARGYVSGQLAQATFQQFISIFESFYFDLLQLWLTTHPQSLGRKTLDFKSILDVPDPDKESITRLVVEKELIEVVYKGPAEWFSYLNDKVKLRCPSEDEIKQFAEAKASRDVLVHNRGIAIRPMNSRPGL